MKQIAAAIVAGALVATPLQAQESEGVDLMQEGARLFFKGLMDEVDPALREMEDMARDLEPYLNEFVEEMGPALKGLMETIEDWSMYHPPEILPNGDILIRRKTEEDRKDEADDAPVDL